MLPSLPSSAAQSPPKVQAKQSQKVSEHASTPHRSRTGHQVLGLLQDNSPAMLEALENNDIAVSRTLMWASPRRTSHAHSKRMDVDCPNENGDTLWIRAAKTGDYPKATKKLAAAGANTTKKDSKGRDAVALNVIHGQSESVARTD